MRFIVFLFLILFDSRLAEFVVHIQYFKVRLTKPIEYGTFTLKRIDTRAEWSTRVYNRRGENLREDEILAKVRRFFDGPAGSVEYESASITRYFGVEFAYVVAKHNVTHMIFENLCSQMKPKLSSIMMEQSRKPSRIEFVVDHPSASFAIPLGFRAALVGCSEYKIRIGGRAYLDPDNFLCDAVINTQNLVVTQGGEVRSGFDADTLLSIKSPNVVIEGRNIIGIDDVKQLVEEWLNDKRVIGSWQIDVDDDVRDTWEAYYRKNATTLKIELKRGRLELATFETPDERDFVFEN
ncbi:unnamed protein product [Caenorhabditis bovis]|uniref:Uncharacterized protein n=1 Tax=Caenorhabditis bovis TaxID=2654633 RepID=A0A8S1EYG3_9PELO|nr:unnamed protein product [Caenorhabditis bovis]